MLNDACGVMCDIYSKVFRVIDIDSLIIQRVRFRRSADKFLSSDAPFFTRRTRIWILENVTGEFTPTSLSMFGGRFRASAGWDGIDRGSIVTYAPLDGGKATRVKYWFISAYAFDIYMYSLPRASEDEFCKINFSHRARKAF